MTDFNYKKYSLKNLENWMHDAMSSAEASPQEIYDVIKGVVEENYYTYKHQASQAHELLALLNGNGKGHITNYPEEYKGSTVSSVTPPWEHYDYTCNKLDRQNPFDKEVGKTLTYSEAISAGWKMTADGFWIPPQKEDKVKKWILPVQQSYNIDSDGEYYVNFPDDLLEATNLKEGDTVEWVDNKDGSYTMHKVTKKNKMEES